MIPWMIPRKFQPPETAWGVQGCMVGCKGNALLGCLRGKAPQELKVFQIFKILDWPLLEDSTIKWIKSKPKYIGKNGINYFSSNVETHKLKVFQILESLSMPLLEDCIIEMHLKTSQNAMVQKIKWQIHFRFENLWAKLTLRVQNVINLMQN